MLHVHPFLQSMALLLALYVFGLGVQRFRMMHLKHKVRFSYTHHVRLGTLACSIWLLGTLGGLYTVKTNWHGVLITGLHGYVGLVMVPFIVFALGSGMVLHRRRKKRTALPLVHGALNTAMLALGLWQLSTGAAIYWMYVLDL